MRNSLVLKIIAVILLPILLFSSIFCLVSVTNVFNINLYSLIDTMSLSDSYDIRSFLLRSNTDFLSISTETLNLFFSDYTSDKSNYCFEIVDSANNVLYQSLNFSNEIILEDSTHLYQTGSSTTSSVFFTGETEDECWEQWDKYSENIDISFSESDLTPPTAENNVYRLDIRFDYYNSNNNYYIHYGILRDLPAMDKYQVIMWMINGTNHFYFLLLILIVSIFLFIGCCVYLFCSVGHKKDYDGIYVNWFNRIPFDLYSFIMCSIIFPFAIAGCETTYLITFVLFEYAACIAILLFCLSFAVRIKDNNILRNTICCRLWNVFKSIWNWLSSEIHKCLVDLPLYWKAALIFVGLGFIDLFVFIIACSSLGLFLLLFISLKVLLLFAIRTYLPQIKKMLFATQELASGNLAYKLDLNSMPISLRKHAANLNRIGEGMTAAVTEQTKAERMKAELITNVSHDLKTPLTSIINYIDLLKKEKIENPTAVEYIGVLDRQATRLKKLTTDLVDASKASVGAISMDLAPTDINIVLTQAVAEYSEKLEMCNLNVITNFSDSLLKLSADGRLLWRVFDNLLGNICKYALSGTRVYISSVLKDDHIVISFKNISKDALNISAEELMERFVRGDSSRSTEGSGLGLSIARSLTELHNGKLELSIDADLFKADVILPLPQ